MRRRWTVLALMAVGSLAPTAIASEARDVLDVPANGKLQVSVNGQTVDTFSSPGMPSVLSLKRSVALDVFGPTAERERDKAARRFQLISVSRNPDNKVGPVLVKGYTQSADLTVGSHTSRATTKWSQADAYDFADALAGPYSLPAPVVRYRLREANGTERASSIPLLPDTWWVAATSKIIGGKSIKFAFAPQFATTVASAAAGAAISEELDGALSDTPRRVMISHGVERPARVMRLSRTLDLGPVSIDRLLVRTADFGSAKSIRDEEPDPSEMTDDIVVNGKRKQSRAAYIVYVGADVLRGCTLITYDKPRHLIHLTCK